MNDTPKNNLIAGEGETIRLDAEAGRLDSTLAKQSGLSRSFLHKLIEAGNVLIDGKSEKPRHTLRGGEQVEIWLPPPKAVQLAGEDIPLDIVYEDADIAVINKPQGMVVHPAPGNEAGTLVNALLHHVELSGIGGELRPGIVHRIDKDTSGLLVIAKNDAAHKGLSAQLKDRSLGRVYHAIVLGNVKADSGIIDAPVGRHKTDRKRMAVVTGGRAARTHYRVLERFGAFTLIEARLESGRTHQIRVHMAHISHPVAGDPVYGGASAAKKLLLSAQALHAKELYLTHPTTGKQMHFEAPYPQHFTRALKILSNEIR